MKKNKKATLELFEKGKKLGDFYWAYADIIRGIGVPAATYDQRIMAFMALKLLIDNKKLKFNFEHKKQFGLPDSLYAKYKATDTKQTFKNIIADIKNLGCNLKYFKQDAKYNPGESENILAYINHPKVFPLDSYIEELPNNYLEMVLDIYTYKANFIGFPKEEYKDLYEKTVARMKNKLTGDHTGQHFTQKSIIHLICEMAFKHIKVNDTIAIYDPTSGTGSMIMESAHYFHKKIKDAKIEVYGQECNGQIWMLSKIFLEITSLDGNVQGIKNIIAYGNTLTAPAFYNGINGEDSFDFIISNPPFGVDWKQDYDKVLANLQSKDSHFFVVKNGKNIVTPKKSDGQFLFMQHIINMMLNEKKRKKRALAAIISSSTLSSTGNSTSSESKIRNKIFELKIVKAILEQPSAMFTNTDISTHIWFFDSQQSDYIKILKADNSVEPMFGPHPASKDKMKNAYSDAEIKKIVKYFNEKKEHPYICKNINPANCFGININKEVGNKESVTVHDIEAIESEMKKILDELNLVDLAW
ncbi:MAG TPA: N-6 DNA methylase [Bacteroidales bacterium]|nr:N-6 DNA methylase [Bacteroidales bacterium]